MNRKDFLKLVSLAGVGTPFYLNGMPSRFMNQFLDLQLNCDTVNDRVLVILRLAGANDGLNTVIPISQYSTYSALRPSIKINNTGTGSYIPLDSTVSSAKLVGLNPSMTGFKDLYDSGKLLLMNGVGYPNPNYSHFRSENLMFAGKDGSTSADLLDGMFGRYLGALYPGLAGNPTTLSPDPLAIQMGNLNPCLFYEHTTEKNIEYNLTGFQNSMFNTLKNLLNSEYQDLLTYIKGVAASMDSYYNRVMQVFNTGVNSSATYPNSSLGKQLKTVARMIQGGSKTKIFQVNISGFDTHVSQVQAGSTHLGTHANLLADISNSLKAFQTDIQQLGIADKIMTVTFSEFGRQVRENASTGTDHGDLAPFFVIGNAAAAGILGDHPVFTNYTSYYYNQNQRRYDYRQIFASLLQDWLGASTSLMVTSELDYYVTGAQKVDVIKDSQKANAVCTTLGTSNLIAENGIKIYPVPANQYVYVELDSRKSSEITYQLLDMTGRSILQRSEHIVSNRLEINVSDILQGNYILKVKANGKEVTKKIIVTH
ncbi:hypothetical protein ACM46_19315 [Chryseobacterium angstadtii]|uniref:Secretion system C-terminal sorting domain-containing protein n=1 Tax=Chryseobacterium angstadtii TaxID=558151 RepID=A0A0J7HZZ2_9FLAO|nr:DUF1501 domain-containing protein [Chryseobacterium angstadtii]KMQ59284.1 hypothetical protein ACM46_19315 [Chryseobacterium angstadtii]